MRTELDLQPCDPMVDRDRAECHADRGVVMQQTQQQVLGADVVVTEQQALLLGVDDDATRVISESLEHEAPRSR